MFHQAINFFAGHQVLKNFAKVLLASFLRKFRTQFLPYLQAGLHPKKHNQPSFAWRKFSKTIASFANCIKVLRTEKTKFTYSFLFP